MRSITAYLLLSLLPLQGTAAGQADDAAVVARARAALESMASGQFAAVEAQFTPEVSKAVPAGRLSALWTSLTGQLGAYRGCEETPRVVRISDKQMVISACRFGSTAINIQFAYDSAGKISGLNFRPATPPATTSALPAYADAAAYTEESITVGSKWALPGTLSLPKAEGKHPVVILVHGSGPGDRDATFGPNKPFRDIAAGLASKGVAVLRYDKRSKVHGGSLSGQAFTVRDEVIDDVVEAIALVRKHPRIDPDRVFVLGHSLGGMLVPRIAAAAPTVNGWIVSAGAARPLEQAILEQSRYLASADGTISSEEQAGIDAAQALAERVRKLTPEDAKNGTLISGAPASYWLDLRGYDPPEAAKAIQSPMLILQGERDYQVTTAEFARWKASLSSRSDVTFRSYPALNHLFFSGSGPSLPAEYLVPGHVAEEVVRDIADWILRQGPKAR